MQNVGAQGNFILKKYSNKLVRVFKNCTSVPDIYLFLCFQFPEPVIDQERMRTVLSLPSFCQKLPIYELDKLEATRKFLVEKMFERKRKLERFKTPEQNMSKMEDNSSEGNDTITSEESEDIIVIHSNSGKLRFGSTDKEVKRQIYLIFSKGYVLVVHHSRILPFGM